MLLAAAAVLAVLWLLGLVVFHTTVLAIHLLLVVALVALVIHVLSGPNSPV